MFKEKEQYLSTLFKTLKMTAKIYFFEPQSKKMMVLNISSAEVLPYRLPLNAN